MAAEDIDKIVMLLSADWFVPFWPRFGLEADPARQAAAKDEARIAVKRMLGDADSYWNIAFNGDRLAQTRSSLARIVSWADKDGQFGELVSLMTSRTADGGTGSQLELIGQLNGLLMNPTEERYRKDMLTQRVREAVRSHWMIAISDSPDYERAALSSSSAWDLFLCSLTSDLPTFLPDFVTVHLEAGLKASRFLSAIRGTLSPEEMSSLWRWYEDASSELTGDGSVFLP